jgi:hypothetical protein
MARVVSYGWPAGTHRNRNTPESCPYSWLGAGAGGRAVNLHRRGDFPRSPRAASCASVAAEDRQQRGPPDPAVGNGQRHLRLCIYKRTLTTEFSRGTGARARRTSQNAASTLNSLPRSSPGRRSSARTRGRIMASAAECASRVADPPRQALPGYGAAIGRALGVTVHLGESEGQRAQIRQRTHRLSLTDGGALCSMLMGAETRKDIHLPGDGGGLSTPSAST